MRFDVQNQLSVAQAFTGTTTVSTNSYQIANYSVVGNKPDISIGRLMCILVMVTTAAGSGSTHTFDAISANDNALTSSVTKLATVTLAAATLAAGYAFVIPIPQKSIAQLYLGYQNTSTGGTTTVSCDAYLVPNDEVPAYASFPKVVDAAV